MAMLGIRCKTCQTVLTAAILIGLPFPVFAMTGPMADTVADILTWVVMIGVPIAVIYLFWMVHVLPEKIAERRHHPQKDAIKVLCLLSLVFGGMLWPLAWLWAYTRPTLHKLAYGTDKHESYYEETGEPMPTQGMLQTQQTSNEADVTKITTKELTELRNKLAELEAKVAELTQKDAG